LAQFDILYIGGWAFL